ncbi:lipid droplet-regulating VLDL assembly factor AUP1-like [Aricia agestis]|uniref:lipid droplet-regulating VLDL assembly factor AUP1-like n=1 Tax=Aricia agestis TaxID=91739 RepID=UPI001C2067A7|nr:lipid droplet-regulating VLDL assembly factor AUP1-like [Aricia agestis]
MALTAANLINENRFHSEDSTFNFFLYLPFGLVLMGLRIILALFLWIASIVLPNKSAVKQLLSTLACWTFGVYVKVIGKRDPRSSIIIANYVSCLDSLAAAQSIHTISLRKWKLPPFFASTLGIKSAAQFVKKEHFTEHPSKQVLLQPEGGPTNGKGLLQFTDWCFPIGNKVQPVAISVERPFTNVTVHRKDDSFPWRDALWYLISPYTVYTLRVLPTLERQESEQAFTERTRRAIADALRVELTSISWEDLRRPRRTRAAPLARDAQYVKEVLPLVPMADILRDLAVTRSVDVTITNFLEGQTPYTPEATEPQPGPSSAPSPPRYVTPAPQGVFPKSARDRQLSFQERKAQMIAEARQKYIEKHGLNLALNC